MRSHGAMNSIPQQDCKGKGHNEFARAIPTTSFSFVAKKPSQQHLLAAQTLYLNYSFFIF
jgi:hypothetical protein